MGNYILAHDLGTSGNKASLYREDGTLTESVVVEYPTFYPFPGAVEQDPRDWWKAVCNSTKQLLSKSGISGRDVAVVSFSAQMMGCLLIGQDGMPLRNMLIWADNRAVREEEQMLLKIGAKKGYEITGHRISASYSAAKLLWIRDNEPEIYKNSFKMLHVKDYIIYRLTGKIVTDYSDASGTNLFDIRGKKWSSELLSAFDIPEELLPELHPSTDVAGFITQEAALATNLLQGTPVVIGGGDGSCACVGAGVVSEGNAYNVLGSSSWISSAEKEPVFDDEMRTFNWVHLDPALYTPCGTMQAAGYSYSWYRNTLCEEEKEKAKLLGVSAYDLINEEAKKSVPGSGGLIYLPYLLGERSPRWNPDARGAFLGLSVTSTKGDMSRALLEGVGYNLKVILDILQKQRPIEELMMIGGGAKSRLWLQILADIWQKRLLVPKHLEEATSMGAAVCAGVGVGIFNDFRIVRKLNPTEQVIEPNPDHQAVYEKLYRIFNDCYEALVPSYRSLAEYRNTKI